MQQGHVVEVFLHPADSSRILTVTDSPYCKPGVKREAGVRRCSVIRALVEITRTLITKPRALITITRTLYRHYS